MSWCSIQPCCAYTLSHLDHYGMRCLCPQDRAWHLTEVQASGEAQCELQAALSDARAAAADAVADTAIATRRARAAEQELAACREEIACLSSELATSSAGSTEVAGLLEKLASSKQELGHLTDQLAAAERYAEDARTELAEAREQVSCSQQIRLHAKVHVSLFQQMVLLFDAWLCAKNYTCVTRLSFVAAGMTNNAAAMFHRGSTYKESGGPNRKYTPPDLHCACGSL